MKESNQSKIDAEKSEEWRVTVRRNLSALLDNEHAELVEEAEALHLRVQFDGVYDVLFKSEDHYALITALSLLMPLSLVALLFILSPDSGPSAWFSDALPVMLGVLAATLLVGRPYAMARRQYSVTFEPSEVHLTAQSMFGGLRRIDIERDSDAGLFLGRHKTHDSDSSGRQLYYGGEAVPLKQPFRDDDVHVLVRAIRRHLELPSEADGEERAAGSRAAGQSDSVGRSCTLVTDGEQVRLDPISPLESGRGWVILVATVLLTALAGLVGVLFLDRGEYVGAIVSFTVAAPVATALVVWLGQSTTWSARSGDMALTRSSEWFGLWTRTKELNVASWSVVRIVSRASKYDSNFEVQFESEKSTATLAREPDPEFVEDIAQAFADALSLRVERDT